MDRFEQQYPGLKVDFTPENDGTYLQKMTVVLSTAGAPVDVMYVGDEQLGTWAEARIYLFGGLIRDMRLIDRRSQRRPNAG